MDQILSQFNHSPALLAARFVGSLSKVDEPELSKQELSIEDYARITGISKDGKVKPYQVVGNIAVIPISGTLVHNLGWSGYGYIGYDVIRRKLNFAANDREIKGIYLPFHTPGGSAFGCADTADFIAQVAKVKPVWGLSEDMAFSGGQWLHSHCSRRLVTQSGGLGSVGVVIAHMDLSKLLDDWGIKVTLIYDGQHKIDGNPYEALSQDVKDKILADCKKTRGAFAQAVAKGTGMTVGDVLATEADCFYGQESVDIGFGEEVVSSNTILTEFAEYLGNSNSILFTGKKMETEGNNAQVSTEQSNQPNVNAVDHKLAERQRIQSIINSTEAKGRESLANHLALNTDLDADVAKGILGASPMAAIIESTEPSTKSDAFLEAMGKENHPNISADAESDGQEISAEQQQVNSMLGAYKMATGAK